MFQSLEVFLGCFLLFQPIVSAREILIKHVPAATVYNPGPKYSLINSVEHHPSENLFCITYTHNNKIAFYKMNAAGKPEMVQSLDNPLAKLSEPHNATFSPDGRTVVVANWLNQTLTVYRRKGESSYRERPTAVIPPPKPLRHHKPHGVTFSPCGKYMAMAYGAAPYYETALAIYTVAKGGLEFELTHLWNGPQELPGIPKGITYSPDGTCLLVTFSDINALFIYNLSEDKRAILNPPRQIIQGEETGMSRPEDIKISPDGTYCVVSNSYGDTVTFYPFDKTQNRIAQSTPLDILQNPEACLCVPHGIAFTPDGRYLIVTEFGPSETAENGDIIWDSTKKPEDSKFNLYQLLN